MSIDVLIVGGGSIGERHLRCFKSQPGAKVSLCESHDARREEVSQRYELTETYSELSQALERPWDAAVVCTPAHLHVEQALQLLPAVDAVLIEKPLSVVGIGVDRLLVAAAGKTVGVAYTYRSHPAVRAVRDLIERGEIGQVLQITIVSGSHFPTHRPGYRSTYYAQHATGGGAIQDAATHLFDLAHYLVGRFDWIFCNAAHQSLPGVVVEDTVHAIAQTANGAVMASVAVNQFMSPYDSMVQINGDRGSIRIQLHKHRYGVCSLGDEEWSWRPAEIIERDDLFIAQASLFLDAVTGKRAVACNLEAARHTLDINAAAFESAATGTKIMLPIYSLSASNQR